jgi:hypothetical protein
MLKRLGRRNRLGNFWAAPACELCSGKLTNKIDINQVDITFPEKGSY